MSSGYRMVCWSDRDARLRNYSAAVRGAKAIVKIELEVADPARLGMLLQELAEIKRDQGKPEPPPTPHTQTALQGRETSAALAAAPSRLLLPAPRK